jgi:hypothetical protein
MTAPFIVSQDLDPYPPVEPGPPGTPPSPPGIDAGVLGLEARHTWWGELGPVRFNQLWDDAGNRIVPARPGQILRPGRVPAAAIYKLTKITGLHSRPDSDDNRANLTGRVGEEVYPSLQRGKTVTYEGTIIAASLADLRRAETQLRRATAGTSKTFMLVEPHPTYGNVPYAYFARAMQLDLADEQTNSPSEAMGPYQRPFIFAVRQHDPRYYVWQQRSAMGLTAGGTYTVTNQGSAGADPVFTLHSTPGDYIGSVVRIFNLTMNRELRIDGLLVAPGLVFPITTVINGYVRINFADRTIMNNTGGSLVRGIDISLSDWWDAGIMGLAPGDNAIKAVGDNVGTFDVQWLDASW